LHGHALQFAEVVQAQPGVEALHNLVELQAIITAVWRMVLSVALTPRTAFPAAWAHACPARR